MAAFLPVDLMGARVGLEVPTSGLAPSTDIEELEQKISSKMWQLDHSKN
jgi:hypothetical protein